PCRGRTQTRAGPGEGRDGGPPGRNRGLRRGAAATGRQRRPPTARRNARRRAAGGGSVRPRGQLSPGRSGCCRIVRTMRDPSRPLRVGFLGPPGTFTEEALLGEADLSGGDLVPLRSMPDVLAATAAGEVDVGFVALENSIEGTVRQVLD